MKARVRENYFLPTARSAGMEFVKYEWRDVPENAIAEIGKAAYLETLVDTEPVEMGMPGVEFKVVASPAAIKFAAKNDVDLADVVGTGKDGKVTQPDVAKYVAALIKEPEGIVSKLKKLTSPKSDDEPADETADDAENGTENDVSDVDDEPDGGAENDAENGAE